MHIYIYCIYTRPWKLQLPPVVQELDIRHRTVTSWYYWKLMATFGGPQSLNIRNIPGGRSWMLISHAKKSLEKNSMREWYCCVSKCVCRFSLKPLLHVAVDRSSRMCKLNWRTWLICGPQAKTIEAVNTITTTINTTKHHRRLWVPNAVAFAGTEGTWHLSNQRSETCISNTCVEYERMKKTIYIYVCI